MRSILLRELRLGGVRNLHLVRYIPRSRYSVRFYQYNLRTFATSADSSPVLDSHTRFIQLQQAVEPCLEDIKSQLQKRNFDFPFSSFNTESDTFNKKLLLTFTQQLHSKFYQYTTDKSSFIPLSKIQLVDFINPQFNTIPQLIYMINSNRIPVNFLEFNNLTTKQQLVTQLLTQLLYQHYLGHKIQTAPQERKTIDFSNPPEWYPDARKMKRKIIMHVGPTNSGKTHNSLLKLEKARSGYYAGPLRLLAREIFEKFQERGVSCNLITGEEVIPSFDANGVISGISSGTVEMIPLHKKMDLCIIDEIQMMADPQRGAAWTNALLGVLAKEIHLCGEESAIHIVKKIVAVTGDELEIKRFKRFGKLTVQNRIADLRGLKPGDCVVAFSRRKILEIKNTIEQNSPLKVGVVYGGLPPEIRSKEAAGFNSGEYDILVASDAIGMGLNLKIKRVIFSSTLKWDGKDMKDLTPSQVKQIAGRAGRYFSNEGKKEGLVTALDGPSLKHVRNSMASPIVPLEKAALWPTPMVWKHYMANYDTKEPFSEALYRFAKQMQKLKLDDYFVSSVEIENKLLVLSILTKNKLHDRVNIDDQITLADAPINLQFEHDGPAFYAVHQMFECIADNRSQALLHFEFVDFELLEMKPTISFHVDEPTEKIKQLENIHKLILLFMWLSQRFPTLHVDKESMYDLKALVEKRISEEFTVVKRINKAIG